MLHFQHKTEITQKNSFLQTQFIDWRTQPRSFKTYPNFFRRFFLDDYEELKFIKNFGKITTSKEYSNQVVNLRVNPSAGGLYPCEIYIQIRGVKGVLSGIYHYEPLDNTITLIHELSNDGVEHYFKTNSKKFIILLSSAYFRSSWKYENRAMRYLLLDCGHQLGSIYSALKLEDLPFELKFSFDRKNLNEDFGFDNQEFFLGAVLIDNEKDTTYKALREKIVTVSPTDYFIKNEFLEEFAQELKDLIYDRVELKGFLEDIDKESLQSCIDKRRSIRAFKKESISKEEFNFIVKDIFSFIENSGIEIFFINNNVQRVEKTTYKNVTLIRKPDTMALSTKLAFNQKLAGDSCFTLFFTSKNDSNLFEDYIISGFLAHIISLRASYLDIQSSGIGAFFDDLCQDELDTKNSILYLQAIGR